jgi:hypothetical protein
VQNPERSARSGLRWDAALVFLVFLLAFFLASFPVRQSTFWLHLGTGKAYLSGQWSFGEEPFTQMDWVNPSWLFDVLLYVAYPEVLGGAGLVLAKSLFVVFLAATLIYVGCIGKNWWPAAACTALTLVCLGPWLDVDPILISILFVGLTIAFFEKGPFKGACTPTRWRLFGPILLLVVLWVNLDQWFILGPLIVAIYLGGSLLTRASQASASAATGPSPLYLSALLVAVLAVCLINPHHFFVFGPAVEQSLFSPPGKQDSNGRIETTGAAGQEDTFSYGHLLPSPVSRNSLPAAVGLAYWALVGLGLLSFILNRERWNWSRSLLWLGFFFLSNLQSQAIPFFAVAGGIILALNVGEFLEANLDKPGLMRFLRRGAPLWQVVGTLGMLFLVATSWTGALQGGPAGRRSWRVEPEPSLPLAAEQIVRWRQQDKLENGFLFSPELANYFSWLDPQEKGLVNSHVPHPAGNGAEDYKAIREGLLDLRKQDAKWRALLRRRRLDHVVLYSNDQRLVEAAVNQLLPNSREWVPLFWKGRTLIFGWQDPEKSARQFESMRLAPAKIAFAHEGNSQAPTAWLEQGPQPYRWWQAFIKAPDQRTLELDEADMALAFFDVLKPRYKTAALAAWNQTNPASRAGLGGSIVMPHLVSLPRLGLAASKDNLLVNLFLGTQDLGPRWAPYLAIRAARRALRDDPENPFAYLLLGEAYYRLGGNTQENAWIKNYHSLGKLRSIQMIAAYKQALRLKPDLEIAHLRLAEFYRFMNFRDYSLQHLQKYVQLLSAREPQAGEAGMLANLKKIAARQQKIVTRLQEEYEINSPNLKVAERAFWAGDKGLAALALNLLLKDDVAAFGTVGMDLELKLLLQTGQIEKVRLWMDEEKEKLLKAAYHWNKVQLHAARGDYAQADQHLVAMIMKPELGDKRIPLQTAAALILGQGLLDTGDSLFFRNPNRLLSGLHAMPGGLDGIFRGREGTLQGIMRTGEGLDGQANINVLRGLLALESGRTGRAKAHFHKAMAFWNSPLGGFFDGPESEVGRLIAQQSLHMLEKVNPPR